MSRPISIVGLRGGFGSVGECSALCELCCFNYPGNLVTVSVNPSASTSYERAAVAIGEYEVSTDLMDMSTSEFCAAEHRLA